MKLRIKGNSLRLRVSRSELARFQLGERIEETIHFTVAPEAKLTYALELALQPVPVKVRYESNRVTVVLSEARARLWGGKDEVGVYETVGLDSVGSLDVIVEKDFACADGSDVDNSDTFPNPFSGVTC
jgi:Family of unknown function (DUF7009)